MISDKDVADAVVIGRAIAESLTPPARALMPLDGDLAMETVVADPEAPAAPEAKPKEKPRDREDVEDVEKRSRKPPGDGPCKMCQQMRPLNRLKLCYPCWLKDKLHKDSGGAWLPGDPHPKTCGCDGPGGCATQNQGN